MSLKPANVNETLDRAIEALRDERIDPAAVEAAGARVWAKLSGQASAEGAAPVEHIRGCADVQALLPAYKAGTLPHARELLVQDHLRECINCRRKAEGRSGPAVLTWRNITPVKVQGNTRRRYAMAAAVLAGAALIGYGARDYFLPAPAGMRAKIETADGPLYLVTSKGLRQVGSGAEVNEREWIRTPRGTHAMIRLRDGSLVEVREGSELSVAMNRTDTTVHLDRGNIIVQAAKRRSGHLFVNAEDCNVAVTGTVFSVNRGTRGSRVAVVEGEVLVDRRGGERKLRAGDQLATDRNLNPVSLEDEISWSRNFDQYIALLKEFRALGKKLDTVPLPGLRYESKLLPLAAPDTLLYASMPNYGQALADAHRLFEEQIRESGVLRQWWQSSTHAKDKAELASIIDKVKLLSGFLGEEVVFTIARGSAPKDVAPLVMAEVKRPGLREFLRAELPKSDLRILTGAELATAIPGSHPDLLITDRIVAIGELGQLRKLMQGGTFASSPFAQRILQAYQGGAGLLFAADLGRIAPLTAGSNPGDRELIMRAGADDLQYLVVEQKKIRDRTDSGATLTFAGERHGLASMLSAPAPMGSLNFVSPEATAVAAAVLKSPVLLVDDIIALAETANRNIRAEINQVERELGVSLRQDLAAALGSDFAVALDGPPLPDLSWKFIVEVNDPARLQHAIESIVAAFNKKADPDSKGLQLEPRGRPEPGVVFELKSLDRGLGFVYSFRDGYFLAAANREILSRASRNKEHSWTLTRSRRFRELLPQDGRTNFSALVFHNLGPLATTLAQLMGSTSALTEEQKRSMEQIAQDTRPALIYVYGEANRIQVASTGGFFGLGIDSILGTASLGGLLPKMASRTPMRRLGSTAAVRPQSLEAIRILPDPSELPRRGRGDGQPPQPPVPPRTPQPPPAYNR